MRLDEPTQHKRHPKSGRQAHKDRLRKPPDDRKGIDEIENSRSDDPGQRMQQTDSTQQLARAIRWNMFRQRGLERWTAHSAQGRNDTRGNKHITRGSSGIADITEDIETDGGANDIEIQAIGAGRALGAAGGGAAHDAGDEGEDDEQDADSGCVDGGEEDAGFEIAPAEEILGVDEDDGHGAHGHAEHGCVDGGEEEEVAPEGAGRAGARGVEDGEGCEEAAAAGEALERVADVGEGVAGPGVGWGGAEVVLFVTGRQLALLGEGFGDEEEDGEEEDDVGDEGDVEDRDDVAGVFDDVAGEDGAEGDAGEEAAVDIAEGDGAAFGRGAVGSVGVGDGHCGDEGAAEAVEGRAHEKPVHGEVFRVGGGDDVDDFVDEHTGGCEGENFTPAVAVREGAEFWGSDGGEDAGDEVGVEGIFRDEGLDLGDLALWVVRAEDDRVESGVVGEVFVADEVDDEVYARDDNAAEGKGEEEERHDEPEGLWRKRWCG